ncbi:hypothetical protein BDR03DRAFT_930435 [Suillus americanus]|nr:hypothetical protein BDR03DRAFT_930435 [Suillus americanus]
MDAVKEALRGTLDSVTLQFLLMWDLSTTIQDKVTLKALILQHILCCAAQTERTIERNKIKDSSTACNVIITQLASQRLHHSIFLTVPFMLFVWTNGALKQTIEALYKCGLCISFTSLLTLLEKLAAHCVEHARQVARQPHMMCYDNINISTSLFVKQHSDAPAKVQSGTFAILYEHRKMPKGYCTKQFPLCTSAIDESLITGNIAIIHDVYIRQLQITHDELSDYAIPSFNNQSTNARIRGVKALHVKDVNPFTHLQIIQLGFGLFHLCLNLIWALLSYFFALLDRTRLGCEHHDYHTLLATLMQILCGIILNAWHNECEHLLLAAFASSKPTVNKLLQIANTIIIKHAMPAYESSSKKQNVFSIDSE